MLILNVGIVFICFHVCIDPSFIFYFFLFFLFILLSFFFSLFLEFINGLNESDVCMYRLLD